jgi:hypothetical protein
MTFHLGPSFIPQPLFHPLNIVIHKIMNFFMNLGLNTWSLKIFTIAIHVVITMIYNIYNYNTHNNILDWLKQKNLNDMVKFILTSNLMLIWISILFTPFFFSLFLGISPPLWPNYGVMVLCFFHFIINLIF